MRAKPGQAAFIVAVAATLWITGVACKRSVAPVALAASPPPESTVTPTAKREVRVTGLIQAVRFTGVQVPQITGQGGGRVTLTRLIANGSKVKQGDLVAEFDRTQQMDNAREAQAKFDDLGYQVDQKRAQNRADAAKRAADLQKAEADLAKAKLQLQKGPLLPEIERLKVDVKLDDATNHVQSLKKSIAHYERADAAALHILELQRDRQKVSLQRALRNAQRMQLKAPLAGMVALENVWRNNSMGNPQEGDQLWGGQPLMRIFDPTEMAVRANVGEPDGAALVPGCRALVRVDAYPDLVFPARFESGSPVAASALGSPIKAFTALFRLEKSDPHLLPDLSAAVVVLGPEPQGGAK
jgi:multidrug resistance efflux pump